MNYEFKGSTVNGAWAVGTNDDGMPCVIQVDNDKGWILGTAYIVENLNQDHFAEQDAHLIAAAPELLSVLVEAVEYLDNVDAISINNISTSSILHNKMKQAIHKALNIQ